MRRIVDFLLKETLIVVVTANPKPRDGITLQNANGAIAACYPNRPDIFFAVDAFEMQRWMKWILCPQAVSLSRLMLAVFAKRPVNAPKKDGKTLDFITGYSPLASRVLWRFSSSHVAQPRQVVSVFF
jgi:hypothetical protein